MKWGDDLYQGLHQPLVSQKQFQEIQAIFKANHRLGKTSATGALLQKLLWCCCGNPMTPSHSLNKNRIKYFYYRCTSTHNAETGTSKCLIKYVAMQKTEDLILETMVSLSQSTLFQSLENKVLKYNQGIYTQIQEITASLTTLQKQLETLKHRQDSYLDSLISGSLSTLERKAISKRLEELEAEERKLKYMMTTLNFDITQKTYEQMDWPNFKQTLITFKEDYPSLSQDQLKTALHLHLDKLIITPELIQLHFKKLPWPVEIPREIVPKNTS